MRAATSGSMVYIGIAKTFSSGIWIVSLQVLLEIADQHKLGIALGYVAASVAGSVLMQYVARRYFERGKRRVGA